VCYRTRMNSSPKLAEYLTRICGPNQQPELVKETEWSYVYKTGEKSYARISKFLLDESYTVQASDIRGRWQHMDEAERLDFVSNFWSKASWNANDTELLEIIMQDGNDRIWGSCAMALLRHPDRNRIVSFLIGRLQEDAEDEPLNYIQALGQTKDKRATPAIRPYFDKYQKAVETEVENGIPEDVVFGPIPYHAYLVASGALWEINRSPEYEMAIRKYLNHSNKQVRYWANSALQGDETPGA
jgi:hypothetical protein